MRESTKGRFRTARVYLQGAICGRMWQPGTRGAIHVSGNARGPGGFMNRVDGRPSFARALARVLTEKGGDFQDPRFTADTVITIDRCRDDGPGRSSSHVREIPLRTLCPHLVDETAESVDFQGDI